MADAPHSVEPFEEFYTRMINVLRFIAHVRFRIPLPDAEGIVHDAFVKYLRDYRTVRDPSRWLAATVANASRNFLRDHARERPLPPDADVRWQDPGAAQDLELIDMRLTLGATLAQLGERCRNVLYRFHVHEESTSAIAETLNTTPGYVQLLLHLCRKRARAIYLGLAKVGHDA